MIKYYHFDGVLYDAKGVDLGEATNQQVLEIIADSPEPIQVLRIPPPEC